MGDRRFAYRILVGRPNVKKPLERPRCRWGNIKIGLQEMGLRSMGWTDLAQDRDRWRALVDAVMDLRFP